MFKDQEAEIKNHIIRKAQELGAGAVGIADVDALKRSPSHLVYGKIGDYKTVGNKEGHVRPGEVAWPENAKSAIVIAVEHAEKKPEMDWWIEGYNAGTPGNRMLVSISAKLSQWLEAELGITVTKMPYHIEQGGILLKDTAVMAGLGCIGKNNLLITPQFGPRVRLRAILTDVVLPNTGTDFLDPCENCDMPCRTICPQGAFRKKIYSKKDFALDQLPARSGVFSRSLCNQQMVLDESQDERLQLEREEVSGNVVKYCRACEFACPVGRPYQ